METGNVIVFENGCGGGAGAGERSPTNLDMGIICNGEQLSTLKMYNL